MVVCLVQRLLEELKQSNPLNVTPVYQEAVKLQLEAALIKFDFYKSLIVLVKPISFK